MSSKVRYLAKPGAAFAVNRILHDALWRRVLTNGTLGPLPAIVGEMNSAYASRGERQ